MSWSYSGNPSSSELDMYRFLISDTDEAEPVLNDAEINFILGKYTIHNERLYHLYDRAADNFARIPTRKLGPQFENPTNRLRHFQEKAREYKGMLASAIGLSLPKSTPIIFRKGMHDHV